MQDNIRQKTISGVSWTTGAQIGRQVLQFVISVILARLLTPQDFGLVGMIVVFTGFAALFGELGFSAALIQKETLEERHLSSIFWLNILTGLILTVLIMAAAPLIAAFYNEPRLVPLTALVALNFAVNPLNMVQLAALRRNMAFRQLTLVEISAATGAGAVAVTLALTGFGVWSLAWQQLVGSGLMASGLWLTTGWRPRLLFDRTAVKELLGFSSNLLGFNVFNYWVRNGDNMLIGKFLGGSELGIYTRAYSTMLLPLSQVSSVLSRVMFPALSKVQQDKARVKGIYLRAIATIALLTFPMMLGLLVVADHFVLALYGPQWAAVIPILQIFCLLGMLQSLGTTVGWIYTSQGRTDWMFRWGIGAGIILIASIVIGVWIGTVQAVAICYALTSGLILLYPSFAIPGKLIDMSFFEVVQAVAGIFGCAAAMALLVWGVGWRLPAGWPHWAYLAVQVPVGVIVYGLLVHLFKLRAYRDVRALVAEQWQLRKNRSLVAEAT